MDKDVALITDGRFSGATRGALVEDRKKNWNPKVSNAKGYLLKYQKIVTSASTGAVCKS